MTRPQKPDSMGYQLFMLMLSTFAIVILVAESSGGLKPTTSEILELIDAAICVLFFVDFIVNMVRAQDRARYFFTWGWIDLLSSIPAFELGRLGRLVRIFRIFRILRGLRMFHSLWNRRAENALLAAGMAALMLITFTSIAVLSFETAPNSNILTAYDAVWWAVTTITTVGYGDKYPVTPGGRLVAVVLMGLGLGLLSTFSAFLAAWFIGDKEKDKANEVTRNEITEIRLEIRQLREEIQAAGNRLKASNVPD